MKQITSGRAVLCCEPRKFSDPADRLLQCQNLKNLAEIYPIRSNPFNFNLFILPIQHLGGRVGPPYHSTPALNRIPEGLQYATGTDPLLRIDQLDNFLCARQGFGFGCLLVFKLSLGGKNLQAEFDLRIFFDQMPNIAFVNFQDGGRGF